MNLEIAHLVLTVVVMLIGAANIYMMLTVRLAISEAVQQLHEWARDRFAETGETDRRFQEVQEGMRGLEKQMAQLWQYRIEPTLQQIAERRSRAALERPLPPKDSC